MLSTWGLTYFDFYLKIPKVNILESVLNFFLKDDARMKSSDVNYEQLFDEYIHPHEAAERLYAVSSELEKHGLATECVEELRLISQRFTRHLNSLEAFTYFLQDVGKALLC